MPPRSCKRPAAVRSFFYLCFRGELAFNASQNGRFAGHYQLDPPLARDCVRRLVLVHQVKFR